MKAFVAGVLFLLVVPVVPAFAQVAISGTEPRLFIQGDYPQAADRLPMEISFDPVLPADITGYTVNSHLKIYTRAQGDFEPLALSGWTRSSVNVWVPTRLFKQSGVLQIKANVDGGDTPIFNVSIAPAPSQAPQITGVSPDRFSVTDGAKDEALSIFGINVDPWGFTQVLIDGKAASIGNVYPAAGSDTGTVVAWMPGSALSKEGVHTVQLGSRAGKSNTVKVVVGMTQGPATRSPDKPIISSGAPAAGTKIRKPPILVLKPPSTSGAKKDPPVPTRAP